MTSIKKIMKDYPIIMNVLAEIYNLIYCNNSWRFKNQNTIIYKGAFLNKVKFNIKGRCNIFFIGPKARLNKCTITFVGNHCVLIIGEGSTIISNTSFWCQDDYSSINIGKNFTMEGGHIAATEGESINIGDDCMFSEDVEIRNGDSHSIIDITLNQRINKALPVEIGNHVWLAAHTRVLKGSIVPSNCIVGNSALINSCFDKENSLYAGIPGKLIKENINWDRNKI